MDPAGGQGYGMGGDHQQGASHPQTPQGNNTNSFSFSNPLASMMSMMQGSPGASDDQNKGQSRAPAKITMNIPSFLPKIQATSASTSGPKKSQEEITKPQHSSGPPSIPSIIPIPKSSPVANSNPPSGITANIPRPTLAQVQAMSRPMFPMVQVQYNTPRELLTQGQSNSQIRSPGPRQQSASSNYAVRHRQPGPSMNAAPSSTNPMKTVHRAGPPGQRNVATAIRGSNPHNRSSPSSQPKVGPASMTRDPLQQPRKNPPLPPPEDPLSLCGDPLATEDVEMEDPLNLQKCDVPGCSHVKSPVISLFTIPQHGLASWCQILKIDLSHMTKGEISSLKICSEHFDLSQFVEGSACKELKPNAVPRPSAFSINAMTTIQTVRREPPVLNFVPVPVPVPIAEVPTVPSPSPDVTIHRIPAPVNPGIQQRSVNVPTQPTPSVRPRAQVPVPPASATALRHPPPSKVQILSVPAPTPTATVTQPPPTENTSLSSANTTTSSLSMESIAQQVGIRKPGPSRGPRGRPRKNPPNVTTPSNSVSRPPLTTATATASSLLKTSTLSNVEQFSPQQVKVAVGSYCRPTIKMKSENVKIDDLVNLVMPSEDWSVNVYPSFNKESKNQICAISETILNSDMVEIVKKSLTVHSSWAMKFSILSKDMSHFNLGLAATDISDLQAVLDNFNSLPCCKGVGDILTSKNYNVLSLQMKVLVERFVDNVFRSVNCPLLIVNSEVGKAESVCKPCRNLLQNLAFLKSQ